MDISAFQKKIDDFLAQGIDTYEFESIEDIVLMIPALRGLELHDEAIELFQKHEPALRDSDVYPNALVNILHVYNDRNNVPHLIECARELKAIYSDHPFVLEIEKRHTL